MRLIRSLLPVLPPAIAVVLCVAVRGVGGQTAFVLFTGSVLVSACFGGLRGGLLATALALAFLVGSGEIFSGTGRTDALCSMILFPVVGVMASCLGHECRRGLSAAPPQPEVPVPAETNTTDHSDVEEELRRRLQAAEEEARARVTALECACTELREELALARQSADDLCRTQTEAKQMEDRLRREIEGLDQDKTRLHSLLEEQDAAMTALRQEAAEKERLGHQAEERLREELAAVVLNHRGREEQFAALQNELGELNRRLAEKEQTWRQTKKQLRQEITALTEKHGQLQSEANSHAQTTEALRRSHGEKEDAWQQAAEQLRREIALREEQCARLQEQLHAHGATADALRSTHGEKEQSWRQTEEALRREIADRTGECVSLRQQLHEQTTAAEESRQAHQHSEESRRQTEEALRRELAALQRDSEALRTQLAEAQRTEANLRRNVAAAETLRQQTEERLRAEITALTAAVQELEATRQRLQEELEAALSCPDDLMDRLGDAVRPLLASLTESLQTARRGANGTPELEEPMNTLERQVRRLATLVESLRSAALLGRGELALQRRPVEVSAILEQVVTACMAFVEERGHHLTVTLPLQPEWITADPERLEQALEQLLDNATRYTPPGGILHLTAERDGQTIRFRVRDNGIGIPARERAGLQRLSAQERCFREGDGDGPGIGLALARSLVELHGGTLTVTGGEPGEGSEVVMELPAPVEAQQAEALPRLLAQAG